jgi:hypothetical protein
MKLKTLAWPASIFLTAWLSFVMGISAGTKLGMSEFHNERIRYFQLDVAEAAHGQDGRTRELLEAAGNLAARMIDRRMYEEYRAVFLEKAKQREDP